MTQKQILVRFTGAEELELHEFLRKESFETGLPMAEIMRTGLKLYKNQKGAEKVKVMRMNKKGHERLDAVSYYYLAKLGQDEITPYAVHNEPFLHGNHLRIDFYHDSGPYTRPMPEVLADDLQEVVERLVKLGVIKKVEMITGQTGYERGDNYSLPNKIVYGAYVELAGTKWDGN